MSRFETRREDGDRGLQLAPFMNIVAILIPMLLLSVVFLKVGVIDVSTPRIAPDKTPSEDSTSADLELTVAISEAGFELATGESTLPPVDGCPSAGPTICLSKSDVDVETQLDRAQHALADGDGEQAGAALDRAVSAYDFAALYSRLRDLQSNHSGEDSLHITASPDIPYKLVVRVMDAIRYKLDEKRFASNEAFWQATAKGDEPGAREELFSEPVLAIGK